MAHPQIHTAHSIDVDPKELERALAMWNNFVTIGKYFTVASILIILLVVALLV